MTATNSQPSLSNRPPGKNTTSIATSSEEIERAIGSLETTGAAETDSSLGLDFGNILPSILDSKPD